MDDLIAFVHARLAEDKSAALGAKGETHGRWEDGQPADIVLYDKGGQLTVGHGRHIIRHDPARVLRQTTAIRAVVDLHQRLSGDAPFCITCDAPSGIPGRPDGCDTLRHAAATWSDHPDYRPEWRP